MYSKNAYTLDSVDTACTSANLHRLLPIDNTLQYKCKINKVEYIYKEITHLLDVCTDLWWTSLENMDCKLPAQFCGLAIIYRRRLKWHRPDPRDRTNSGSLSQCCLENYSSTTQIHHPFLFFFFCCLFSYVLLLYSYHFTQNWNWRLLFTEICVFSFFYFFFTTATFYNLHNRIVNNFWTLFYFSLLRDECGGWINGIYIKKI